MIHDTKLSNTAQDLIDAGVIANLLVVMLQEHLFTLEYKGASLSQGIFDVLRGQILDANVVRGGFVRLAQGFQRLLVVPIHHGIHCRRIPHCADTFLQVERITNSAALVSEAHRGIDAQLRRELCGGLARADPNEEHFAIVLRQSWEDIVSQLRGVLPAQESSVVTQERQDGHFVRQAERRA
ncbi:hypothetical protein ACHAWF_002001 [Thalassiosira exigua]